MNVRSPASFVRIDKKNGIVGAAMGTLVLVVCCIWFSWKAGVAFGALFLAAGFLKLQPKHPLTGFLINGFWGVACIMLSCATPVILVSYAPGRDILAMGHYRIVMNIACAAVVYGAALVLTGKIKPAVAVASGALLIFSTVNAYVYAFRGSELKAMDFLSVGTAMKVAGQYTFSVDAEKAYCWFAWLWTVFALRSLPEETPLIPKLWFRLLAACAAAVCAAAAWSSTELVPIKTWANEGSAMNGYFLNFAVGLRDSFVEEPEGYSGEIIESLEAQYAASADVPAREDFPNIIVIMNESFADFRVLGGNFRTNQPVIPFVDTLEEDTIKGFAQVSIYGGSTANSEYEFLTGSSMAWMPEGSVPYQQYVRGNTYSLAWLMQDLGYTTMTTHPFSPRGWNRTRVYPLFGFQSSTFLPDYPGENLLRSYVSDREMYEYVLDLLDNKGSDPLFLFGITMQNHGGYETGEGNTLTNYVQHIELEGYQEEYPHGEMYLSLLHESDRAVEFLLSELEAYPEDTLVVFFGDHLPRVEQELYEEIHGSSLETLDEKLLQYTVPFFIWANYDIPEQTVECTSLNYLGRYMLEAAGISLPPYYRFLAEAEKAIPAVSAMGYYSLSRQAYLPLEEAQGEEARWLSLYEAVQYNGVFDSKDRSGTFFGRYIPQA
nr:LTA synthase family protein [Oscillospiraceae bacterium]